MKQHDARHSHTRCSLFNLIRKTRYLENWTLPFLTGFVSANTRDITDVVCFDAVYDKAGAEGTSGCRKNRHGLPNSIAYKMSRCQQNTYFRLRIS